MVMKRERDKETEIEGKLNADTLNGLVEWLGGFAKLVI